MLKCIPPLIANKFKLALKQGDITIGELLKMSSEDRTKLFERYDITNGRDINKLFESKLILKNQYVGLKNFIDKLTASGRYSPEKIAELKKALEDFKARQKERILSPSDGEAFLNELADRVAGTHITIEQAQDILNMNKISSKYLEQFDGIKWSSEEAAQRYGSSRVVLENYLNDLKTGKLSLKEALAERVSQFKDTFAENKGKALKDLLFDTLKFISDNSISLVATFDNSFMGRQGLKTLMTKPSIWWREDVVKSFRDMAREIGGQNTRDAMWADMYSRPDFINGEYQKAKIFSAFEEQYPSSIPSKIPGIGRLFKASEQAFTGSALRSRTALYDYFKQRALDNGVVWDKYQIESFGKVINSLTARGQWGKRGESPIVRLVLWAPKMLKANIDVLTGHFGQDISLEARKVAAVNLLKIVTTTASIMAVANAIKPGSAELDPRSTDFGKIKAGNTRFDITGGAASLLVLASRLITNSSKSTTTGNVSEFGTGFGQRTIWDVFTDFLSGKTTPPIRMVVDFMKGRNFQGEKPTIASSLFNIVTPISIQNAIQLKDDSSANAVLGVLLDTIGINASTYTISSDWTNSTSKELAQFKTFVGDTRFREANKKYDAIFNAWYENVKINPQFTKLTQEQQQQLVSNKKSDLKEQVMSSYGFKYQRATPVKLPNL